MKVIEYKGLYDSRIALRPQEAGEKECFRFRSVQNESC